MQKQTANNVIRFLKDNDYVVLIKSKSNKNEKKIAFTEKGEIYSKEILTPLYELEQKVYSVMGTDSLQEEKIDL